MEVTEEYDNQMNTRLSTLSDDEMFRCNEGYCNNKTKSLECRIYLYRQLESWALVFHFNSLFDITIEGQLKNNKLVNKEYLHLPKDQGRYFILTPEVVNCRPIEIVDRASKDNTLNGTVMTPKDWIYQALVTLNLDKIVKLIDNRQYVETLPPQMEPKETLSDFLRNKATNFASGVLSFISSGDEMSADRSSKKKPVPVSVPQFSGPHVPSEYDGKERNAVIIRYNKDNHWAILFHFVGDDAFRTAQGIWDGDILKPSLGKERPKTDGGVYMELDTLITSPVKIKDLILKNDFNGAQKASGITEIDWAKRICDDLGVADKWDRGIPWKYFQPPQYTVGPERTVFVMPSSKLHHS